jgi:predicted AlkP superfamily phosphohydrolase/phosphomutase
VTGTHAPIIVVGLDACDVGTVRNMAHAGKLPTLERLLGEWSHATVRNPYGFFVGALWPSFFTARSAARTGFHCWDTITPETYERRLTNPREIVGRPFWYALSDAGHRVAVLDVPHTRVTERLNGIQVVEYGCHDRHFGLHTSPPELAAEIVSRVGPHPIFGVDTYAERQFAPDDYVHRAGEFRNPEEERALLRGMLEGLERKRRLSTAILADGGWDLFISVFGESHAIGHQCWHLHDPAHPRHDARLARELGDPLEHVYAGLDKALGDHLALVPEHSTVFVLLSHGMGPHYDGTHLLEEVLARIDAADTRRLRAGAKLRLGAATWNRLPGAVRDSLTPVTAAVLRRYLERQPAAPSFEGDRGPEDRARRRFFMSPNNSVYGGVRMNVQGREPRGVIRPGAEFDAACEQLKHDLLALVNVDTGAPVVRSVERTDARYVRSERDELPDLLIDWNHDAPADTAWSPKTGIVHVPYKNWRTGDHTPGGFLLARGPGIAPRADLGKIDVADLGPSICSRLGVSLCDVDGRPCAALSAPRHEAAAA